MFGTEVERILVRIVADATTYDRVLDGVVGKMTQTAARLTAAGRMITIGITAPLIAMATMSVMAAGRFEYSAAKIQGAANLSVSQISGMTKEVRSLARELGQRPTALIDTFEELTKGGQSLGTILKGSGRVAAQLATVGELSSGLSATTLIKILNIFRRDNMQAADAANVLSAAADASVISIQDMVHSVSQGASMAGMAGQSFKDFAAAIAMLGQAGMVSRDAGTSMKTFFMALASGEREKYFKKFGMQVEDAQGKILPFRQLLINLQKSLGRMSQFNQLRAVGEMFGADAARAAIVLGVVNKGAAGFDEMKKKMEGAMSVQGKYGLLMNTFNGQMSRAIGLLEDVGIEVGMKLTPYLRAFGDQIGNLIHWWQTLTPFQQDVLFQFGLIAAAIGPAMLVTARFIGVVQRLVSVMAVLGSSGIIRPITRLFGGIQSLLMSGPAIASATVAGINYGRAFVLGIGTGLLRFSSYLYRSAGALWRIVVIAFAPIVSLFTPIVMDIVYVIGGAGLMASRAFASAFGGVTRLVLPVFAALWTALNAFVAGIPAVFAALRVAMISFVATIPAVLSGFKVAFGIIIPWVMSLGAAMAAAFNIAIAPVFTMLISGVGGALTTLFGMVTAGIGSVITALATFAVFPVVAIGGIILIVEAVRMLIGSMDMLGNANLTTMEKFKIFAKTVIGFFANIGENWDLFTRWFSQNWGAMLLDMLKMTGMFFLNMGNNTWVGLKWILGRFMIWSAEVASYIGEAFAHGAEVVWAWTKDTFNAIKDWAVRVGATIWDALTGGDIHAKVLQEQAGRMSNMAQLGQFKPSSFGKDYDNWKNAYDEQIFKEIASPLDGFKSSMSALPKFKVESKFADDLFENGMFGKAPEVPAMPDMKSILDQLNGGGIKTHIPDFGKIKQAKEKEFDPGSFKEISLNRFVLNGRGGLSGSGLAKPQRVESPGIETKLELINRTLKEQRAILS